MTHTLTSESTPFTPVFSESEPYPSVADGTYIHPRPMAQLFFPDARTAVNFINAAMDEQFGTPITIAAFRSICEGAYIGKASEYDGSVITNGNTGEVRLTITSPYRKDPEAHAQLRRFVLDTIGVVVGQEAS